MLMHQRIAAALPAPSDVPPEHAAELFALTNADGPGPRARTPDHARNATPDYATTYLWLDAGQSWPFLRNFEPVSERILFGWLAVVAACCGWAMIMMMTGGTRPMEATLQMERLADKLESAAEIPAATGNAVERLLGQRWYDCRQVSCSAELAVRNEAVRTRLNQLSASKGPANEVDVSANRLPRLSAAAKGD
jgi:hypothetical protein